MLLKLVEKIVACLLYIGILVSPLLIGCFLGVVFFFIIFKGNIYGYMLAAASVIAGLLYGIFLAEYARRRMSAVNFMGVRMHNKEFNE